MSAPASVVYTVGHGARPTTEFLAVLDAAGIRTLVDVRTSPGSRKHPQFGRDRLAVVLADGGMEYAWRRDLGGWRRPAPGSRHTGLASASFRGYADHMETPEFASAVEWLEGRARAAPTAFLCAETLWWRCHRRMIADVLLVRGWRVLHLGLGAAPEPHRLHPAARVEGGRLVYDGEVPEQGRPPG